MISVLALRSIPLLGIIATIHCVLFLYEKKVTVISLLSLFAQMTLIVVLIHIRSTSIWELGIILLTSSAFILLTKGPTLITNIPKYINISIPVNSAPILFGVALYLLLTMHRTIAFPNEYRNGEQILTRPIWHNIYSGLSFNPDFAKKYELRIDDMSEIRAAGHYLLRHDRAAEWEYLGGTNPGYSNIKWEFYDKIIKEMLIEQCQEDFILCAKAILVNKPISLTKNILWVWGLQKLPPNMEIFVSTFFGPAALIQFTETSNQLDAHNLREGLWKKIFAFGIFIFIIAAFLFQEGAKKYQIVLGSVVIVSLGSTIPSIIGYPAPTSIAEPVLCISLN